MLTDKMNADWISRSWHRVVFYAFVAFEHIHPHPHCDDKHGHDFQHDVDVSGDGDGGGVSNSVVHQFDHIPQAYLYHVRMYVYACMHACDSLFCMFIVD